MKKIVSVLCVFSLLFSLTTVFAVSEEEKEYTSEGGYFYLNGFGETIYTGPDGSKFEYYFNEDENTVSLYYMTTPSGNVTVPSSINGITVTFIGGNDGNTSKLVSLELPDTITDINGFFGYDHLKEVELSENITSIKYMAFYECTALESIEIPGSVKKIESKAFDGCTSLRSVKFNEGLESIDDIAFADCQIESIAFPSTLKSIGKNCFLKNTSLKEVTIPASVEYIGTAAFRSTSLESVTFEGIPDTIKVDAFSSEYLEEVNGFSKDEIIQFWTAFDYTPWQKNMENDEEPFLVDKNGRLVAYIGSSQDIVIPDTVKVIGENSFSWKNIVSVEIPDSVTEIENYAFYGCENIRSITIPGSVIKIGNMAFQNCYRLKNIEFEYSEKTLNLGSSAFAFTLASPETVITNNRNYSNKNTAFENTYFDEDYVPVSVNGVYYDDEYTEPDKSQSEPEPVLTESPETETVTETETVDVISDNGNIEIYINGDAVEFTDAKPFIDQNGRTQIPIRAVAEALDCDVEWDDALKTVTITKNDMMIVLVIDNYNMQINNEIIAMDTVAQIINDRTYIPIRYAAEALGFEVNWN